MWLWIKPGISWEMREGTQPVSCSLYTPKYVHSSSLPFSPLLFCPSIQLFSSLLPPSGFQFLFKFLFLNLILNVVNVFNFVFISVVWWHSWGGKWSWSPLKSKSLRITDMQQVTHRSFPSFSTSISASPPYLLSLSPLNPSLPLTLISLHLHSQ